MSFWQKDVVWLGKRAYPDADYMIVLLKNNSVAIKGLEKTAKYAKRMARKKGLVSKRYESK